MAKQADPKTVQAMRTPASRPQSNRRLNNKQENHNKVISTATDTTTAITTPPTTTNNNDNNDGEVKGQQEEEGRDGNNLSGYMSNDGVLSVTWEQDLMVDLGWSPSND